MQLVKFGQQHAAYVIGSINLVVGAFVLSFLLEWIIGGQLHLSEGQSMLIGMTLPTIIGFILFPLFLERKLYQTTLKEVGLAVGGGFQPFTMICLIFSFAVSVYVFAHQGAAALPLFLHYIAIGFGEEILFRGIVQRRFQQIFPPMLAVLLSSLIFAIAFHSGYSLIDNLLLRLPMGIVLGLLYVRSRSIWTVGSLHTAYNFYVTYYWV